MMAAGYFTEDEIRNAIINAGYEISGATTTTTPNIINQALNQNLGGGDGERDGPTTFNRFNRDDNLGTSDYYGTGPGFFESLSDYVKSGGTFGAGARALGGFFNKIFKPKVSTYFTQPNLDAIAREKARQEKERAEFLAAQQRTNIASQLGGSDGQSGGKYAGGAAFASANPYGGSGTMDDLGADRFKDGGLVTMFVEKK